jgi:homoserine kinase
LLDHPDLLGICLSGAGPSVVGFATRSFAEIERRLSAIYDRLNIACRVRTLAVHRNAEVSDCEPNADPSVFA